MNKALIHKQQARAARQNQLRRQLAAIVCLAIVLSSPLYYLSRHANPADKERRKVREAEVMAAMKRRAKRPPAYYRRMERRRALRQEIAHV